MDTNFYPRSPCGERPCNAGAVGDALNISIHALLAESDVLPCNFSEFIYISIHALLAESDEDQERICRNVIISIHALLAESDRIRPPPASWRRYFYPRSPCGERLAVRIQAPNLYIISIHALLAESDS